MCTCACALRACLIGGLIAIDMTRHVQLSFRSGPGISVDAAAKGYPTGASTGILVSPVESLTRRMKQHIGPATGGAVRPDLAVRACKRSELQIQPQVYFCHLHSHCNCQEHLQSRMAEAN